MNPESAWNLAVNSMKKRARQEILDDLLLGKDVGKHTFEGLLDCALQHDENYRQMLLFITLFVTDPTDTGLELREWVERQIKGQITQEMVQERAEHLAECEEELSQNYSHDER